MGLLDILGIQVERTPTEDHALGALFVDGELLTLTQYGDAGRVAISAAYRGSQLLTDLTAATSWRGVVGSKHSDQAQRVTPATVNPTPMILVDPSPFMDADEVKRMLVSSLIFRGNGYLWLQNHDRDGRPRFATPLHPDEVDVTWDKSRMMREYRWREQEMIPGFDIAHVMMPPMPGQPKGLGPFDAGYAVLNGIIDADGYARSLFADSGVPSGHLTHPGKLLETEADALAAKWDEKRQGNRGTAVLSGGIAYESISMTPEQAQFLGTRAFGTQEVARLLGIGEHFLNAGNAPGSSQSLTYTNVQAVFRELAMTTIYPTYMRRIERLFTPFLPRGVTPAFNIEDLYTADDGTRYTALAAATTAGILTVNEAREKENLPPLAAPAPTQPQEVPADV